MTTRDLADQAARTGITDARLLDALRAVRRVGFVPPEHADDADRDVPVPIGHRQVTTQPTLVAAMLQALELTGEETVLEIGSGHGYQTALLARLTRFVWSVEWWGELAAITRANLAAADIDNVRVVTGDGTLGLPEHAPYDAIVVSAAFPRVPPPLVDQLVEGGRLVQPIGRGGDEEVILFGKQAGRLQRRGQVTEARFVRLLGTFGFPVPPD